MQLRVTTHVQQLFHLFHFGKVVRNEGAQVSEKARLVHCWIMIAVLDLQQVPVCAAVVVVSVGWTRAVGEDGCRRKQGV